ncbi:hypothetical protein HK104_002337 [Borealophlyctis nickersoniae]|nr:hypothetical protein HK104_002337 [Borealophlyctis nickersoniae]
MDVQRVPTLPGRTVLDHESDDAIVEVDTSKSTESFYAGHVRATDGERSLKAEIDAVNNQITRTNAQIDELRARYPASASEHARLCADVRTKFAQLETDSSRNESLWTSIQEHRNQIQQMKRRLGVGQRAELEQIVQDIRSMLSNGRMEEGVRSGFESQLRELEVILWEDEARRGRCLEMIENAEKGWARTENLHRRNMEQVENQRAETQRWEHEQKQAEDFARKNEHLVEEKKNTLRQKAKKRVVIVKRQPSTKPAGSAEETAPNMVPVE